MTNTSGRNQNILEIESETASDGYDERFVRTECLYRTLVESIGNLWLKVKSYHWHDIELKTHRTAKTKQYFLFMESFSSYSCINALVSLDTGSEIEVEMLPVNYHPIESDRYAEIMYILSVVLIVRVREDSCSVRCIPCVGQSGIY